MAIKFFDAPNRVLFVLLTRRVARIINTCMYLYLYIFFFCVGVQIDQSRKDLGVNGSIYFVYSKKRKCIVSDFIDPF